ncbi:MAG: DIP1984 family protein [Clostridia bacterium]|nr:DIP1984 family protein [Clostridia bacterium]
MKLATALSERADLQRRLSELSIRLNNNAKVQEGEKPAEDPTELLKELDEGMERLEELISRINRTNNETKAGTGTLSDLIAHRDCLKERIRIMRDFLNTASEKITRYSKTEIRILSAVPVAKLQKTVDAYAKQLRETDEQIQGLNWTTELL